MRNGNGTRPESEPAGHVKKKQGSQREQSGVNEHKFIGNRSERQCRRMRQ